MFDISGLYIYRGAVGGELLEELQCLLDSLEYDERINVGQVGLQRFMMDKKESYVEPPGPIKRMVDNVASVVEIDLCVNSVFCLNYPVGVKFGYHTDPPEMGEHVISVSISGRARQSMCCGNRQVDFELGEGDVCVMTGRARRQYRHAIFCNGGRKSIILRNMKLRNSTKGYSGVSHI